MPNIPHVLLQRRKNDEGEGSVLADSEKERVGGREAGREGGRESGKERGRERERERERERGSEKTREGGLTLVW